MIAIIDQLTVKKNVEKQENKFGKFRLFIGTTFLHGWQM